MNYVQMKVHIALNIQKAYDLMDREGLTAIQFTEIYRRGKRQEE
jgi:hypothetical protein